MGVAQTTKPLPLLSFSNFYPQNMQEFGTKIFFRRPDTGRN
jgi:hypothetical protein